MKKNLKNTLALLLYFGFIQQLNAEVSERTFHRDSSKKNHPSLIYTRQEIMASGAHTVAEFLRTLPQNSFGSKRPEVKSKFRRWHLTNPQIDSVSSNVSNLNFKGVGASKTLILLNNQSLPLSSTDAEAHDLEFIALSVVEKIEIYDNGLSAQFGPGAISGVVNIVTRALDEGVELVVRGDHYKLPQNTDLTKQGSLAWGLTQGRFESTMILELYEKDAIISNQLPWTKPINSFYGNTLYGYDQGFDDIFLSGGCDEANSPYILIDTDYINRCTYDLNQVLGDDPSSEKSSFFSYMSFDINEKLKFGSTINYGKNESISQYSPAYATNLNDFSRGWGLPDDSPNNPSNPNSPLYDPAWSSGTLQAFWHHTFDPLGNRLVESANDQFNWHFDVSGQGESFDYEFGIKHAFNELNSMTRNSLRYDVARDLIISGQYDLSDPFSASDDTLNAMKVDLDRSAKFQTSEINGHFSWRGLAINEETAPLNFGVSIKEEKYFDHYDSLSITNQEFLSIAEVTPVNNDRTIFSAQAGWHFPIQNNTQLNVSLRNDHYSDIGSNYSSRIELNHKFNKYFDISIHSSKDFVAPSLKLNTSEDVIVENQRDALCNIIQDPITCITTEQILSIQNKKLEAEKSENNTIQFNYRPIDSLMVYSKFYKLKIKNTIREISAWYLLAAEEVAAIPVPHGLGCDLGDDGNYSLCRIGLGNLGQTKVSGVDVGIGFNHKIFNGHIESRFNYSHLYQYRSKVLKESYQTDYDYWIDDFFEEDNSNELRNRGKPDERATWVTTYNQANWHFALQSEMIGSQTIYNPGYFTTLHGTYVTHGAQLSLDFNSIGNLTFGIRNMANKRPPLFNQRYDSGSSVRINYNHDLYDAFGRTVFFSYKKKF